MLTWPSGPQHCTGTAWQQAAPECAVSVMAWMVASMESSLVASTSEWSASTCSTQPVNAWVDREVLPRTQ